MFEDQPPYGRLPGDPDPIDWEAKYIEMRQRHHDIFVRKFYEKGIQPGKYGDENFRLAVQREWNGEVDPLGPSIPKPGDTSNN